MEDIMRENIVALDDLDQLFRAFQQRIVSFIASRVGSHEQAHDLTQDTFIRAFKALQGGTIVHREAFQAWIYRIATNATTDMLRRKRRIVWVPLSVFTDDRSVGAGIPSEGRGRFEPDEGTAATPVCPAFTYTGGMFEDHLADREIVEQILWSRMDAKHSLCLWLYEHDGLSCAEIGEVLHISTSAVKMRIRRARQAFVRLYRSEMAKARSP